MTLEEIEQIISEKEQLLEVISIRRSLLLENYKRIEDTNILATSLYSPTIKEDSIQSSNKVKDLYTIYEQKEKSKEEYLKELLKTEELLYRKEQQIYRIDCCFNSLSSDYYLLLYKLLVVKEKQELLAEEFQISKTTLQKKKKSALTRIQQLYESSATDIELLLMQDIEIFKKNRKKRKAKKIEQTIVGQISLF